MARELHRKKGAGGAGGAGEVFQAEGVYVKHLKQELDGFMFEALKGGGCSWNLGSQNGRVRFGAARVAGVLSSCVSPAATIVCFP